MATSSSMRSALGKARSLGSARTGVSHWWSQRLTAIGMIPLVLYLVAGLVLHAGAEYHAARAWISAPFNATAALLFFGVGFYHASLGVQVIIEDYVSNERRRLLALVASKMVMTGLAALSLFSVLSVALA